MRGLWRMGGRQFAKQLERILDSAVTLLAVEETGTERDGRTWKSRYHELLSSDRVA